MGIAPQVFSKAEALPVDKVAECLGLYSADVDVSYHEPVVCSVGLPFVVAELRSLAALQRVKGVPASAWAIHAYVRASSDDSVDIRCRMVASGFEDPATGSANCALIGLLASMEEGSGSIRRNIAQGVEMGRPSLLLGEADFENGNVTQVRIGGNCVAVMKGKLNVPVDDSTL